MELERKYLKDIAHHLDEAKWDRFGHQSRIVAHGIQDSGLLREMSSTRESISRLAAMADYSFDAIIRELTINNQMMSGLLRTMSGVLGTLQNPKATAASELYGRGVKALYNDWIPEAIKDLEESVTPQYYPYNPGAHFALGCAYAGEKRHSEAASAFFYAVRYSLRGENYNPELACGAALLGSGEFLTISQLDEARQLLQMVHEGVPECPEVALAISRRWNADADVYRRALSVAPELAAEAFSHALRRGSVDTIEVVSDDLCFGRQGLSGQLERVRASHEQLTKDLTELGGTVPASHSTLASHGTREESPNTILLAGMATAMNEQISQLAALVNTVDSKLREWSSTQNSNLSTLRSNLSTQNSNLGAERSRLDQKERNHRQRKEANRELGTWAGLWALGIILFVYLWSMYDGTKSPADVTAPHIFVFILFWPVLGLALLVGLFIVIGKAVTIPDSISTAAVTSREHRGLDQQQTEIENKRREVEGKQREIEGKQREIEGHLQAARQVLASWPPKRVVPFFPVEEEQVGFDVVQQTGFDVVLQNAGPKKIQVIKEVRATTGLGLKEAKALVDEAPNPVREGIDRDEAETLKAKLEEAGAIVELK